MNLPPSLELLLCAALLVCILLLYKAHTKTHARLDTNTRSQLDHYGLFPEHGYNVLNGIDEYNTDINTAGTQCSQSKKTNKLMEYYKSTTIKILPPQKLDALMSVNSQDTNIVGRGVYEIKLLNDLPLPMSANVKNLLVNDPRDVSMSTPVVRTPNIFNDPMDEGKLASDIAYTTKYSDSVNTHYGLCFNIKLPQAIDLVGIAFIGPSPDSLPFDFSIHGVLDDNSGSIELGNAYGFHYKSTGMFKNDVYYVMYDDAKQEQRMQKKIKYTAHTEAMRFEQFNVIIYSLNSVNSRTGAVRLELYSLRLLHRNS
jgi:hypothetical protein